jgi:hypothetical protein
MSISTADAYLCACGRVPVPETYRPAGRVSDLHRISCKCGLGAPRWSVSAASAIRLWNSIMTTGEALPDDEENAREAG